MIDKNLTFVHVLRYETKQKRERERDLSTCNSIVTNITSMIAINKVIEGGLDSNAKRTKFMGEKQSHVCHELSNILVDLDT